jgi:hypothetical protein
MDMDGSEIEIVESCELDSLLKFVLKAMRQEHKLGTLRTLLQKHCLDTFTMWKGLDKVRIVTYLPCSHSQKPVIH